MDYRESVEFLYAIGNEFKTGKLGLERMTALAEALGHPERSCRHIHVAGTNGKGSTCAMIDSALRAAGIRSALYTSPHLVEPTERIRVDGRPVTREEFVRAFDRVRSAGDVQPTYFETVTAMAFVQFRESGVDTAVVEVGLGGRLDATNIVLPQLSVITPVDYDHQSWLGNSIEQIAAEKAGILKPETPALIAPQRPDAGQVIERAAASIGAPLRCADEWRIEDSRSSARDSDFTLHSPSGLQLRIHCPLAGEHQIENARTAAAALDLLGVPAAAIESGIAAARWPGRLECVSERPEIYLDGAHNPAGARALASYIKRFHSGRRVTVVFGAMQDKDIREITSVLFPLASDIILTRVDQPRAIQPDAIDAIARHPDTRSTATVREAVALLTDVDLAFITGSLYLVGEARPLFTSQPA